MIGRRAPDCLLIAPLVGGLLLAACQAGSAKVVQVYVSLPVRGPSGTKSIGELLQISSSATWPGLTKPGFAQGEPGIFYPTGQRTFFRTTPTDDAQATAAALWARSLGLRTFYVLDDGEAYGAGIANLFSRYAQQIGLYESVHQTVECASIVRL